MESWRSVWGFRYRKMGVYTRRRGGIVRLRGRRLNSINLKCHMKQFGIYSLGHRSFKQAGGFPGQSGERSLGFARNNKLIKGC